jgi:hypothetical protein
MHLFASGLKAKKLDFLLLALPNPVSETALLYARSIRLSPKMPGLHRFPVSSIDRNTIASDWV